jgi:large subunit ribosomal protein L24
MVRNSFSTSWNRSTQVRKQRKYRVNAPLHIKQKFVGAHLAPALRTKYGKRSIQVRKGDRVKILRGSFKKKEGKVERVDIKRQRVFITGIEIIKKEGAKVMQGIAPSNLLLLELELGDKKRKQKLEKNSKKETKIEKKEEKKIVEVDVKKVEEGKEKEE